MYIVRYILVIVNCYERHAPLERQDTGDFFKGGNNDSDYPSSSTGYPGNLPKPPPLLDHLPSLSPYPSSPPPSKATSTAPEGQIVDREGKGMTADERVALAMVRAHLELMMLNKIAYPVAEHLKSVFERHITNPNINYYSGPLLKQVSLLIPKVS